MGQSKNKQNTNQGHQGSQEDAQGQLPNTDQPEKKEENRPITDLEQKILDEAVLITTGKKATDYDLMQLTKKYIDLK